MAEPVGGQISHELRRVFEGADLTQPELAERLGVSQSTVSDWARGARMPPVRAIALIEELAQVPRGTVLRRAGYIDEVDHTVEAAIHADPGLDPRDKDTLLGIVQGFRMRYAARVARDRLVPDLDDPDEAELWGLTSYSEDERRQLIQGLRDIKAQRPPRRRRRRAG